MRLKLYLDTSVLGAVCDPGPEERLAATHRLLGGLAKELWDGYISTLVLEEVERAPKNIRDKIIREIEKTQFAVLEETQESLALARAYVAAGAIPTDYEDDARHIAVATVSDIRTIVSWNFRHMVNIERKRMINSVNLREDVPLIDIVSPWEVSYEEA
ncbi:MAG TPA: PIN domain-containing protein [Nitrospiria bacterium]|jgi:predicted nucleic acid-binding protein